MKFNKARRILFFDFVTTFGGVQRVLVNFLPQLQKRGFDVLFLDPYEEPITAQRVLQVGVNRIRIPIWPPHRTLRWKVWYRKLAAFIFLSPFYGWYMVRLRQFIQKQKISAIYTNSKKGVIFSAILSLLARIPLIYHAHGFNSSEDITWLFRQAIGRASIIIAVSDDVRKKLINAGISSSKVVTIYNGVPIKEIRLEAEQVSGSFNGKIFSSHSDERLKILVAASLQPAKGIHIAVKAVKNLLDMGIDCEMWVAGKIPLGGDKVYVDRLQRMVKSWGLDRRIKFLGWIENVYWLMNRVDVVVVPSLVEESFGMVLAEAMALGKPTIGSRIGGIPEVIDDGVTGYLFTPGNAEELSEKLILLARNKKLRESMGNRGYQRVLHFFSVSKQVHEIGKVLDEIFSGKNI